MSILTSIVDAIADIVSEERKRRLENPCEWADELRARQRRFMKLGWDRAAAVAKRRAERWEAKCAKKRSK